MQRVMGRVLVHWAWMVKERTGSLGEEEREMRGFEVVRDSVRCDKLLLDSAWAFAIFTTVF